MKIEINVVGVHPRPSVVWPEGWPVPREGEEVHVPGLSAFTPVVRHVLWFPMGDPEDGESDPYVYVVVGRMRPE